mgnify:CR=1 FL=1
MVAQAAREIRDGERVFVGMRLPLIAFVVAKRTHAPHAIGLFELGIARDAPAPELLYTMGDGPNVRGAVWCARTIDLMGLLQRGEVDVVRHHDEVYVTVGPYRRSLVLPDSLRRREVIGARLTGGELWVRFGVRDG